MNYSSSALSPPSTSFPKSTDFFSPTSVLDFQRTPYPTNEVSTNLYHPDHDSFSTSDETFFSAVDNTSIPPTIDSDSFSYSVTSSISSKNSLFSKDLHKCIEHVQYKLNKAVESLNHPSDNSTISTTSALTKEDYTCLLDLQEELRLFSNLGVPSDCYVTTDDRQKSDPSTSTKILRTSNKTRRSRHRNFNIRSDIATLGSKFDRVESRIINVVSKLTELEHRLTSNSVVHSTFSEWANSRSKKHRAKSLSVRTTELSTKPPFPAKSSKSSLHSKPLTTIEEQSIPSQVPNSTPPCFPSSSNTSTVNTKDVFPSEPSPLPLPAVITEHDHHNKTSSSYLPPKPVEASNPTEDQIFKEILYLLCKDKNTANKIINDFKAFDSFIQMETFFLNDFFTEYKLVLSEKIRFLRLFHYSDINNIESTNDLYLKSKFLFPLSASLSEPSSDSLLKVQPSELPTKSSPTQPTNPPTIDLPSEPPSDTELSPKEITPPYSFRDILIKIKLPSSVADLVIYHFFDLDSFLQVPSFTMIHHYLRKVKTTEIILL